MGAVWRSRSTSRPSGHKHLEALRNVGRWLPCGLGCWLPLMFRKYYRMFLLMITMLFPRVASDPTSGFVPLACPDGLNLFAYTACLRGSPSSGVVVRYFSVDVELLYSSFAFALRRISKMYAQHLVLWQCCPALVGFQAIYSGPPGG